MMAWTTPKTNWTIDNGVSTDDLNRIEGNLQHLVGYAGLYGVTSGNSTTYTVSIPGITALTEGTKITVKLHVNNGANATLNVNSLGAFVLRKANGNAVPAANLKLNSIYTFVFSGSAFILQGEGGGGTAQPEHVLAPHTFTNENGEQTGTIPTITSGSDPAQGVGQWPDGGLAVYPSRGYRKGGAGEGEIKVTPEQLRSAEADLRGPYILSGHSIYGTDGTMPNRSAQSAHMPSNNATAWSGDRIFLQPPDGWYDGSTWVTAPAPALVSNNLRENTSILGIQGNMVERGKYASSGGWVNMSTANPGNGYNTWVVNVGFKPQTVWMQWYIRYGSVNIYNDYVFNQYFGYAIITKDSYGTHYQHVQNDGYTTGPQSGFGVTPNGYYPGKIIEAPTTAYDWYTNEHIGSNPKVAGTSWLTSNGFATNENSWIRDNRGQDVGMLNWFAI
ncbi:hypothetical protein D3C71_235020 [compost metagenome]